MAREWETLCADCGKSLSFSDTTYRAARLRGEPTPAICFACVTEFVREKRALGRTDTDLPDDSPPVGRLAAVQTAPASHVEHKSILDDELRKEFGVSDAKLGEFFTKLDDPLVQVILVEAPTGAGKSTFFPYRLLVPPAGVPDPEVFTRNGQIVVTQPRIWATRNLPAFVSQMYGCRIGAGYDIGFRYSKEHAADWNCDLVYLTDGTLINWIAGGQLGNISLIMLDEAHERSLNIDLIIGLLTRVLPRYPWLKLVIASATIDAAKFVAFFNRHLRGGAQCKQVVFEGKAGKPVRKHFRCGLVEWHDPTGAAIREPDEAPVSQLPYDPANLKELLTQLPKAVADTCAGLLGRMYPADGEAPGRGDLKDRRGDILAFLWGQKAIDEAIKHIKAVVDKNPVLKACVDVLPLYTTLPKEAQLKALAKPTKGRTRVILSTNVAETSLTLHGIKHVVETGVINRKMWDPRTETGAVRQFLHSQAGCRQRWGRAGRVSEGDAWCTYTKEQFDAFDRDTPPGIKCSQLEPIILTAKAAGVDRIDADSFPWLDDPDEEEVRRANHRLRQHGALDADGDLTAHGAEIQRFGGDVRSASLMIQADRFACLVEMATILPLVESGATGGLLVSDKDWDDATARQVRGIHAALTWGCRDDLELVLKVFTAWTEARSGGPTVTASWAWPKVWAGRREPLPAAARAALGASADDLVAKIAAAVHLDDFDALAVGLPTGGRVPEWFAAQRQAFARAAGETWAKLWFVNETALRELEKGRDDKIDQFAVRKKEKERRALNFEALDRVRVLLAWASPDLCFVANGNERDGKPMYDRLADTRELDERVPVAPGGSPVESDEGDEDDWARPAILLEVSDRSICRGQSVPALVGFGSSTRNSKPHPNAESREFINVKFVVRLERDWLDDLPGPDPVELASFLADHFPPAPPADPAARRGGPILRRLFVDQKHPVFSQYECRVVRPLGDGRWEVDLLRHVAHWPQSRAIELASPGAEGGPEAEGTEPVAAEAEESEAKVEGGGIVPVILTDILNAGGEPVADPNALAPPEDADDSDEDPEPDEDPERMAVELPEIVSPPAPALVWEPVRAVVVSKRATLPATITAEVTGYEEDHAGGLSLLLASPTPELCFDEFQRRFKPGDRLSVEVVSRRPQGRVLVREPESEYEAELSPEDLAFVPFRDAAEGLAPGTALEVVTGEFDLRTLDARLTTLPLTEDVHRRLREHMGGTFTAVGRIVEALHNRVRFVLTPEPLLRGESLPRGALLTAEIYHPGDRGRLPLQIQLGRECNLRVRFWRNPNARITSLAKQMPDLAARLTGLGLPVRWDPDRSQLSFQNESRDPDTGRWNFVWFTDALRRAAVALSPAPEFQAAIDRLYRQSHTLQAEPADRDIELRYPPGMVVRGEVISLGEPDVGNQSGRWGDLRLDSGLMAGIPPEEFRPGDVIVKVGDVVRAMVLSADVGRQQIRVTLRDGATAYALIRAEILWSIAAWAGLTNQRGDSALRHLGGRDRAEVPARLAEAARRDPWLHWARLRLTNPGHTGLLIGSQGIARRDLQEQTGAILAADAGEVYLLAPDADSLEAAIEGVERRLPGAAGCDIESRHAGVVVGNAVDPYGEARRAPVECVAKIPPQEIAGPAAAQVGIRKRLAGLLSQFGVGRI